MGGATLGLRLISIVSGILLARILDPKDFGIVALAQVVLGTTNLFSGFGLGAAIVQSLEDRGKVAYQSFVITAVSGLALFVVIFLNARIFAGFLGSPQVTSVLQWMSLTVLLAAWSIVPEALLQKDLLFGRVSGAMVVSELLYVGIALSLAYLGAGLWSLVYASLARSVMTLALLWFFCPGWEWVKPKPWDGPLMKRLLGFGIHSTGGGVVTFFYSIIDNLIVGKWLGAVALGYYSKAYDFTRRTVDQVTNVVGAVLLPSYAKIQTDSPRLSRAYLKSLRLISFLVVPVSTGLFITGPEMVETLLGEKWLPMVSTFQILSLAALVKPLSATTSALFLSTGRPAYNLRAGLVVVAIMLPLIVLLMGFGIEGVAFAVLCAQIGGFAYNMFQVRSVLERTASRMISAIAPALGAAAVMLTVIALLKAPLRNLAGGGQTVATLGALVLIGALVYGGLLFMLQRALLLEMVSLSLGRFLSRE
jgi:O-antigen/teichoic acid export membrane protein